MNDLLQRLAAPFDPAVVSWRCGSTTQDKKKAMALAYIDARDVMARLDEVVGPENWQRRYPWSDGKRLCCDIGIRIDGEWVWKGDGAGDTDVEAEKGAFSDAFKRAAVSWGIGRYLYDLASPWVEIEPFGKSYKIKDSEKPKLLAVLRKQAPAPAPRQTKAAPAALPDLPDPKQPNTLGDILDHLPPADADWPAWVEYYKEAFTNCASVDDATALWIKESKSIAAFKAADKAGYDAFYGWVKTEGQRRFPRAA